MKKQIKAGDKVLYKLNSEFYTFATCLEAYSNGDIRTDEDGVRTASEYTTLTLFLDELHALTDFNCHTERTVKEAELCGDTKLLRLVKLIAEINDTEGCMPIADYRWSVHERISNAIEQVHGKEIRDLIYNA